MQQENYIQYSNGYSKENINMQDIMTALADLKIMDDEHGAFWVSVIISEENVLEVNKNLSVVGVFDDDPNIQYQKQFKDLDEIQNLYSMLLHENIAQLKKKLEAK